jgi:hypothetical protein
VRCVVWKIEGELDAYAAISCSTTSTVGRRIYSNDIATIYLRKERASHTVEPAVTAQAK